MLRLSCEIPENKISINSISSCVAHPLAPRTASRNNARFSMAPLNTALISESPKTQFQRMIVPVQAWYFVTEVPSQKPCVQAAISNSNAEAFLDERELKLDSGMPREHPLAPLKPSLQIDIRKPVQSEDSSQQHLEHVVTMHLPYMELLKQLFENRVYSCAVTTSEDQNKWILEVGVANRCCVQNNVSDPRRTMLGTGDVMASPSDFLTVKENLRSCLDRVMAYELGMENKVGRLETVQEMTTAITASRSQRTEACRKVLTSLIKTNAEAEIPLQWSRFLSDVKNGDPVCMDPQQIECMIKGSVLCGLHPQLMIFNLNACATVAVRIAQKYGVHHNDIQGIDTAVATYIKSTSAVEFRKMVLEQVRDELIANAQYTGDPSWKPEFSVKILPDQQLAPYQKKGDMFAKVEVNMVKAGEPGEDQSIPGFTAAHLLMQEFNSRGGVPGDALLQNTEGGKERTLKFHFDCEDSAAFLAATAVSWNLPEEDLRKSIASICELMPPSVSELQATLTNMMMVLKEQSRSSLNNEACKRIDLQKLDSACLLRNIAEAKQQTGEYKFSTTALLAKAPSIGASQTADNAVDRKTSTDFDNFSADMFSEWWRSQPLNGHAIVTSGTIKHVMTIDAGGKTVHIKMLGDDLNVVEGTGPAYQVEFPNSQAVSINLDKQPSTDMRRNLQFKLKNTKLNIPMANNVKSSLHVSELQNILNFRQIQQSLQQNMQQGVRQNTQNIFPVSGMQLAARQTFSLNCAATTASQRMVATDNSFYVTMLCRGAEGLAYTVDTSKTTTLENSQVQMYFGGSLVKGLVQDSETILLHAEMDLDEVRRCTALGALTSVTMLSPEQLIPNLPTITSRQLRQQMRVLPQTNTIVPLTAKEISIANSFSCGILTQRNERVEEQEFLQNIADLSNEAAEVIGCTPIVHCNGFSSSFCLRYP